MKPVKTKYTQGEFVADDCENMPYSFVRTPGGNCIVITWKGTLLERLKFLCKGRLTVWTMTEAMPPMLILEGTKI